MAGRIGVCSDFPHDITIARLPNKEQNNYTIYYYLCQRSENIYGILGYLYDSQELITPLYIFYAFGVARYRAR